MKRISDAIREIVESNPLFHFGLHERLLNLSQVARFLRPLVEARTRKEVTDSAVLMSLSRLQNKVAPLGPVRDVVLDKINIHSGLCSLTVYKSRELIGELNRLFSHVRSSGGFITITEGLNEVTAILEDKDFALAEKMLSEPLRHVHRGIASVGVKFTEENVINPGMIYRLLQQVALQNINVIELASTATEFNIYVTEEDVRLAFDSIFRRFAKRAGGTSDI